MQTSELHLIDTHCHLYSTEFDDDRDEMIERAIGAGIQRMMMPNIDLETVPLMWDIIGKFPQHCFPMMGLHPCSVRDDYEEKLNWMRKELDLQEYAGIGETGVDLYWDITWKEQQIIAFEHQIEWAKDLDLPVIIHSRDSLDLNIELISTHQDGRLRGIFHCFGGSLQQALQIHDLGFKAGIGGVATFKKAGLKEILHELPLDLIVLETDAPYLAPVPHRGKRNEPFYLLLVAELLANVLGKSVPEIAEMTTANALAVFRKKG